MADTASPLALLRQANDWAEAIARGVQRLATDSGARREVEDAVLDALDATTEALEDLNRRLDAVQGRRHEAEPLAEAIDELDRKRLFFHACTMRRSAALAGKEQVAATHAAEAEHVASSVAQISAIDQLVEAYKATERLESNITALREMKSAEGAPEPRVLDLPRARILVARRAIGARIVALDDDDGEGEG